MVAEIVDEMNEPVGPGEYGAIVASDVAARVAYQLGLVGAQGVPIDVAVVPEIPRMRLGKAPLIRTASRRQAAAPSWELRDVPETPPDA